MRQPEHPATGAGRRRGRQREVLCIKCWLVNGCNRFPDLRAAAARKTLKSLKESTWNTIRTVIKQWGGAVKDEHYHINNVAGTLRFRNDKRDYHARPDRSPLRPRLRAVRLDGGDHCRDEASEVSQKTVEVLFSRLRWKTHETFKVSKMLLTPNPTTNWIRSRFVQNDNGERATCREGGGCVPFSVCDNPDIASRPTYESTLNKISDHATKDRLPYDNWDFVEVNDTAVYNRFDGALHLVTGLRARAYDPSRPPITLVALLPFVSVHIQKKARPEAAPIQP
ncbi:phage terminase large subunit [Alistipes sp.]|uniref:phage terminase large subunit n=1 Tax=Alistipes sp. TaxID=1872444 RepID=UPI0025BC4CB9|nr:phage terminase large subunit [Alistipes sp.]